MKTGLPPFTEAGLLPPGIHWATWGEIRDRFGHTPHRMNLLFGLMDGLGSLKQAGCKLIYIDGSFCTAKEVPGDFDVCWDDTPVDLEKLFSLAPLLFDFEQGRAAQKARYLGEFFPCSFIAAPPATLYLDFFQLDKNSGGAKGIIGLQL
ncbi:DUF6932 family protein [Hymenobacter glacieicola]